MIAYALAQGYRRLAWMMIDADVAYVSPTSVYRILIDADLLYRWKRSTSVGERRSRSARDCSVSSTTSWIRPTIIDAVLLCFRTFGSEMATIFHGVTKLARVHVRSATEQQVETIEN